MSVSNDDGMEAEDAFSENEQEQNDSDDASSATDESFKFDEEHEEENISTDSCSEFDEDDYSDADWNDSTNLADDSEIQGAKDDLLKKFKSSMNSLMSEKKWFAKKRQLTDDVEYAIQELNEAFYGLENAVSNLPKGTLNEFQTELGETICGSGLVRKLCGVICKMYPKGHLEDKETLNTEFEMVFKLISGFMAVADATVREVATVNVFLDKLTEILDIGDDPEGLKETLEKPVRKHAIECLQNLAMDDKNYQKLRKKNFVSILSDYYMSDLDDSDDSGDDEDIKSTTVAIIAVLMDERESETIPEKKRRQIVKDMNEKLEDFLDEDSEGDEDWPPTKIMKIIRTLARHDHYKRLFGRLGTISLLVKVAQKGNKREQAEATNAIWVLSFYSTNQKMLIANQEAMNLLQLLRKSEVEAIAKNCEGTFWTMKDSLLADRKYKHLVPATDAVASAPEEKRFGNVASTDKDSTSGHVMISYQWGHQKTLKMIRDTLKNKGYNVWMDVDKMRGSIMEAMADAVEKALVVLVCFSKKYKNSPNCRSEAEYCFKLRKPVIPLKMDSDYDADGWLGLMTGSQKFIDFSGKYPFEEKIAELLTDLPEVIKANKQTTAEASNSKPSMRQITREKTEPYISLTQLTTLRRKFHSFDQNGDGRLSVSELGNVLRSLGLNPTECEIKEAMQAADINGNGYIDSDEYISLLKSYLKDRSEIERELKTAFKLFSKGTGELKLNQLKKALIHLGEKLTEEDVEELFDEMDANEDGVIDIDEFVSRLCEVDV